MSRKKSPTVHKGIYYWTDFHEARDASVAIPYPSARVVPYELGYAVQLYPFGPYLGPDLEEHGDSGMFAPNPLPSSRIGKQKARRILHEGEAHGRPLTPAQRRMFGAASRNPAGLRGQWARAYERLRKGGYGAQDAHRIARTLQEADDAGLNVQWEPDQESSYDEGTPQWWVAAVNEDGDVLDSLGAIDLGETGPDAHHSILYQYDAEAQVLGGALAR